MCEPSFPELFGEEAEPTPTELGDNTHTPAPEAAVGAGRPLGCPLTFGAEGKVGRSTGGTVAHTLLCAPRAVSRDGTAQETGHAWARPDV